MTPQIIILGTRIHQIDKVSLKQRIVAMVRNKEHALVLNVNVHCLNLCFEQPALQRFMNQADVVFCDGFGVRLMARIVGFHLPPRITYADWIWEMAEFCTAEQLSLYFVGSKPGIAEIAIKNLRAKFPELAVVGWHHGYYDLAIGSKESQDVIRSINEVKPDILLVGLGMPLQEYWLRDHWHLIEANVALTGGAVLDYVAGEVRRAPSLMINYGFEWLGRLLIEPRRLWRRYLIGIPQFLWRFFRSQ